MNEHGQSLIETIIGVGTLTTLLVFGLPTVYMGYAKVWLRHFLYEAAICEATLGKSNCEAQAKLSMKIVLPIGDLVRFNSMGTPGIGRAVAHFWLTENLQLRESVSLKTESETRYE